MILYTPVPFEHFAQQMADNSPQYQEIEVPGAKLIVEQTAVNQCRVVRLISSNPQDYLRSEYQPGTELKLTPTVS